MTARHLKSIRLCGDDARSHFLARYELARSLCLGSVYQTAHARPRTNQHVTKMRRARSSPFAFRSPFASSTIWRQNSVANSATSTTVLARSRDAWAFAPRGKRKYAIQKHNAPPDQRSSLKKRYLKRSCDLSPASGSSPARSRPHFSVTDVSRAKTRIRCTIHKVAACTVALE